MDERAQQVLVRTATEQSDDAAHLTDTEIGSTGGRARFAGTPIDSSFERAHSAGRLTGWSGEPGLVSRMDAW